MENSPNELRSVEELEETLSNYSIPWEDIAPRGVIRWLEMFSKSHGCSKDLVLLNMLACTGLWLEIQC